MSILSRNKFFAGRRLPESVKCGGLRAAVFCYGCRRRKCLPRVEMPAERRYVGRCEGRPVCSAAVFLLWPAAGRNVCRGTKCRPRGDMPGGLFGRAVGAIPGRLGCRFVRSPILRRRLLGCRFVRLPIRSGSIFCRGGWPVFGFAGFPGRFSRRRLRKCQ